MAAGWQGNGQFNRVYSWTADAAAGLDISAVRMDADTNNITVAGFNNVLTRDGQGSATADLPMNGFQHTGAAAATAAGQYVTFEQLQGTLPFVTTSMMVNGPLSVTGTTSLSGPVVGSGAVSLTAAGTALSVTNSVAIGGVVTAGSGTIGGVSLGGGNVAASNVLGTVGTIGGVTFSGGGDMSVTDIVSTVGTVGGCAFSGGTATVGNAVAGVGTIGNVTFPGAGSINQPFQGNNGLVTTEIAGGAPASARVANLGQTGSNYDLFLYQGGAVGSIMTTGSATLYNTTSDQRLKTEVEAEEGWSGRIIDRLRPKWFVWKKNPDSDPEPGFFAQQVYRVFPWAVVKGRGRPGSKNFQPWQMDNAKFMPVVIAELQSLRAENKVLKKRLIRLEGLMA